MMKGMSRTQMSSVQLNDEAQETAQVDPNRWRVLRIILIAPFSVGARFLYRQHLDSLPFRTGFTRRSPKFS